MPATRAKLTPEERAQLTSYEDAVKAGLLSWTPRTYEQAVAEFGPLWSFADIAKFCGRKPQTIRQCM